MGRPAGLQSAPLPAIDEARALEQLLEVMAPRGNVQVAKKKCVLLILARESGDP